MKKIYLPDWIIVLNELSIGGNNLIDLNEKLGITYSHLHGINKEFIKRKWVKVERLGGRNIITLTLLGKATARTITVLCFNLDINENIIDFRRVNKK